VIGSHLDSIPEGGWLDGCLGVLAGAEILLGLAARGTPPVTVKVVDWADEEGVRFGGQSMYGSATVAGALDPTSIADARDAAGVRFADAARAFGVDLTTAARAGDRLTGVRSYLELHIEQGPVLERLGVPVAAVSGCVGVQRHRLHFTGRTGHAGTTPMDARHDAGLAAAATALEIEQIGVRSQGTATTGALAFHPGIATAIAGEAELVVDLRHGELGQLHEMLSAATDAAQAIAAQRGCKVATEPIWAIEPIDFDETLVGLAREACASTAASELVLRSGALHDAAEVAGVLPVAMLFAPSIAGISHAPEEDTAESDLAVAIEAFGVLCQSVIEPGRVAGLEVVS
jgi:N-carbamoyl-L-amino-acid hydrolase